MKSFWKGNDIKKICREFNTFGVFFDIEIKVKMIYIKQKNTYTEIRLMEVYRY